MFQSTQDTITQSEQRPEAEPDHEQYVSRLHQHRHNQEGGPAHSNAATEAEAEAAAEADAVEGAGVLDAADGQEFLHAPYSHLLWCEASVMKASRKFGVSRQLCTDIASISSSKGSSLCSGTPVQVTVLIHPAVWDQQQYVHTQLQLDRPAGQQQDHDGAAAAGTLGPKVFGPYAATLKLSGHNNLMVSHIQHQHEPQSCWQYMDNKPHQVVVQERVGPWSWSTTPEGSPAAAAAAAGGGGFNPLCSPATPSPAPLLQPLPVQPCKRKHGEFQQQEHAGIQAPPKATAAAAAAAAAEAPQVAAGHESAQRLPAACKKARRVPQQAPSSSAAVPVTVPIMGNLIKVQSPEVLDLTEDSGDAVDDTAAAAAAAAADRLPAGLRLASASSLTAIEDELLKLMTDGVMPLLPAQQYVCIMGQLQQLFASDRVVSLDVSKLQRKYKYVQAAAMGGRVAAVVEALQALIGECRA